MSLLQAIELHRFYHNGQDEVMALRGVSLAVDAGDFVALVGPSGSGKSTLLSCLGGLDDPDGGRILYAGRQISRIPESERLRIRTREIGMVLQGVNLISHLTVEDNVRLPVDTLSGDNRERLAAALLRLEEWGLGQRRTFYPHQLSGGERARVALAVAMASTPRLLLLDEPTGEVDEVTEDLILDTLDEHCQRGGAAVIATHSRPVAARATRVVLLETGRLANG